MDSGGGHGGCFGDGTGIKVPCRKTCRVRRYLGSYLAMIISLFISPMGNDHGDNGEVVTGAAAGASPIASRTRSRGYDGCES